MMRSHIGHCSSLAASAIACFTGPSSGTCGPAWSRQLRYETSDSSEPPQRLQPCAGRSSSSRTGSSTGSWQIGQFRLMATPGTYRERNAGYVAEVSSAGRTARPCDRIARGRCKLHRGRSMRTFVRESPTVRPSHALLLVLSASLAGCGSAPDTQASFGPSRAGAAAPVAAEEALVAPLYGRAASVDAALPLRQARLDAGD